jgi:exonuclease SbcD
VTRILAFSDLHLGAGQDHRRDALADQEAILNQIADLAIERQDALVINAGDTFHRARPDPPALHVFKRFCARLAEAEIPMVALGGNGMHEAAPGQRSALELFESRWVRVSRTPELVTEFAGVAVATLPAASPNYLAAACGGGDRATLAEATVDLLLAAARDLYEAAPPDRPRILVAHQMVSGATLPTGLPVEQVGSVVLPLWALEEQGWDAVVLGDIHRSQVLSMAPFTAYCGSSMTLDFGEQSNDPGVWILEFGDEMLSTFVPLSDRRFVTVDVDLTGEVSEPGRAVPSGSNTPPSGGSVERDSKPVLRSSMQRPTGDSGSLTSLDETDLIAAAIATEFPLTDAVVRVRYKATEAQHRRVDQAALLRLLDDAGIHRLYGGLAWQPVREQRVRAEGLDEGLPPLVAVDLWLVANTVDGAQAEALRALLAGYLEAVA